MVRIPVNRSGGADSNRPARSPDRHNLDVGQLILGQLDQAGLGLIVSTGRTVCRRFPAAPHQRQGDDQQNEGLAYSLHCNTRAPTTKFTCSTPTM